MIYLAWLIIGIVVAILIFFFVISDEFRFATYMILAVALFIATIWALMWSTQYIIQYYHKKPTPITIENQ